MRYYGVRIGIADGARDVIETDVNVGNVDGSDTVVGRTDENDTVVGRQHVDVVHHGDSQQALSNRSPLRTTECTGLLWPGRPPHERRHRSERTGRARAPDSASG